MNLLETKLGISPIACLLLVSMLILGITTNVSGQITYHFEEDFSNDPSGAWTFEQWIHDELLTPCYCIAEADHTWTFDEEMVSAGPANTSVVNVARINDTTIHGVWSIDVYVPSNSTYNEIWDTRFYISTWLDFDDWQAFKISADQDGGLRIEVHDSSSGHSLFREAAGLKYDTYQHYDLIRTPDLIYLFVDQELIIEAELSSTIAEEINFFEIDTAQGSGIKFDNVKISTEYQKKLIELDQIPDGSEPTEESKTPTTTEVVGYLGLGAFAMTAAGGSYRYLKKKDIEN